MKVTVRTLAHADVTFTISIEDECDSPADQFDDAETLAYVRAEIASGNEWAWCAVTVTAAWEGFEGRDHLGGCSYASETDFRECGYFADMCARALEALNAEIADAAERLEGVLEVAS